MSGFYGSLFIFPSEMRVSFDILKKKNCVIVSRQRGIQDGSGQVRNVVCTLRFPVWIGMWGLQGRITNG